VQLIEKRPFGRTGHMSTATIFGGAALMRATQKDAERALEILLKYGVNHIDTAPRYEDSEILIGHWMARHRKDLTTRRVWDEQRFGKSSCPSVKNRTIPIKQGWFMTLSQKEIRDRALEFASRWGSAVRERSKAQTFWNEFSTSSAFPGDARPPSRPPSKNWVTRPAPLICSGKVC
jgi:hypothetical protein